MIFSVIVPLFAATYVSAHGYVARISIDGQTYEGNDIASGNPFPSVIRQISTNSPVKGARNPAVNCGPDARPAALMADANPGSQITFDWRAGNNGEAWPHNTGPMMTYLASCGDISCADFNPGNAQWFKIEETGRKPDGRWYQGDLMNGDVARISLPRNLARGNYMMRHEILALHLGGSPGGAEFYPSCAQIRVGGNGNGRPQSNELVTLPGAYDDNEPGILTPNIFDPNAPYTPPGPPVASFVSSNAVPGDDGDNNNDNGSGNNGDNSGNTNGSTGTAINSSSPSVPPPAPTAPSGSGSGDVPPYNNGGSGTSTGSSGTCNLKKRTTGANSHRPRHLSRVMRDLVFGHKH